MTSLPELIAIEVMNAIERERRINKDDLIMAAEVAIGKFKREQKESHPLMVAEYKPGVLVYAEPTSFTHTLTTTASTATSIAKPGCLSSADAAQRACLGWMTA